MGTETMGSSVESKVNGHLASLPNLLDDIVPDGADEADNELVHEWGDTQALPQELGWTADFEPLWHDDVASILLGLIFASRLTGRLTKDNADIANVVVVISTFAMWLFWLCAWMHQWHPLIKPIYED